MSFISERPWIFVAALILLTGLLRGFLALTTDGYLGIDGGGYLTSRNDVVGRWTPEAGHLDRPPLAPGWLLVPFTHMLGDDTGLKLWSVVTSLVTLPAVYLFARRFLNPAAALVATALVAVDPWMTAMVVTGAQPMLGFSLILLVVLLVDRMFFSNEEVRVGLVKAGVLAVTLGLIAWVNQTSAGLACVALLSTFGVMAYRLHRGEALRENISKTCLVGLMAGSVLALLASSWYSGVTPLNDQYRFPGPLISPDLDMNMFQFMVGVPLGLWALRKGGPPAVAGALLLAFSGLMLWQSADEVLMNVFYRSRIIYMMILWPVVVWALMRWMQWKPRYSGVLRPILAVTGICVLLLSVTWVWRGQAEYSQMVSPATSEALEMLKERNDRRGIITNMQTMSWWVNALNEVDSPYLFISEPPKAYSRGYAHSRCVMNWLPTEVCDPIRSAKYLGVGYVLVDTRLPYVVGQEEGIQNWLAPPDQYAVTASASWLNLVYDGEYTKLWEVVD